MEESVAALFERYTRFFAKGLAGEADLAEAGGFYADSFIAATPAGVMAGENDDRLAQAMADGYARYRAAGMTAMAMRTLRLSPIDELHAVAHVAWRATYARDGKADVAVDFDVHYLIQALPGTEPRIFGWVSGDEEAVLRAHGLS